MLGFFDELVHFFTNVLHSFKTLKHYILFKYYSIPSSFPPFFSFICFNMVPNSSSSFKKISNLAFLHNMCLLMSIQMDGQAKGVRQPSSCNTLKKSFSARLWINPYNKRQCLHLNSIRSACKRSLPLKIASRGALMNQAIGTQYSYIGKMLQGLKQGIEFNALCFIFWKNPTGCVE